MNVPTGWPGHNAGKSSITRRFFTIAPVATPGASAASYVPIVVASRALAFVRLLVVARLLGAAGKAEFGLYQPAQELINWVVPVVLFGLADVGERYASRFERAGRLRGWLQRQYVRLLTTGAVVAAALLLLSPWIAGRLLEVGAADRTRGIALVAGCAATILALALYQHLSAVLRGLRAYGASAGMELLTASLLLLFSSIAAWRGGAVSLVWAYAAAVLVALAFFGWRLWRYVRALTPAPQPPTENPRDAATLNDPAVAASSQFYGFGAWAFLRLLCMMTFSAISIVGIMHLGAAPAAPADRGLAAHNVAADYAMPYRIAQLLTYIAATLWASTYGIAARAWTHGQIRRAEVQMFRVGKWGAVLLTLLAVVVLLARGILAHIEADYAAAITALLPPLLAVFLWYGLLSFWSLYGDLHEKPWFGAILWGAAVLVQLTALGLGWGGPDPKQAMILACACGTGFSLLVLVPLSLWHPFRFSATAMPMALLAIAPVALFAPPWVVDGLAVPIMLGAVLFLFISGLLLRPLDRRAWRRWRARRSAV